MKKPTYLRSYEQIVDYLLQFAMTHIRSDDPDAHAEYPKMKWGGPVGFVSSSFSLGTTPMKGDLVRVEAMRDASFRLGWMINADLNDGNPIYRIKSCKTGEEADWSNVGISILNRHTTLLHPMWKWDDEQWENWDEFQKIEHDDMRRLMYPVYNDNGTITFRMTARYGLLDGCAEVTIPGPFPKKAGAVVMRALEAEVQRLLDARPKAQPPGPDNPP